MKILSIESSCDETAAAIVENGTNVLASVISSSSPLHARYGGILPELAAREQLKYILPVITQALHEAFSGLSAVNGQRLIDSIDAIAVSVGPGLIGSLLIGVETAKTIAMITGKPIIPVNHVLAHIYANFVNRTPQTANRQLTTRNPSPTTDNTQHISFPAIALVVSGGHTELFFMESEQQLQWIGGTIDDAAGEAFDKTARLLGFENRGGVAIQEAASTYNPKLITHNPQLSLPRPMIHDDTLNFSFSGLKTAVSREWKKHTENPPPITHNQQLTTHNLQPTTHNPQLSSLFAYEIQEAITDVLVTKTLRAAEQYHAQSILVAGGVAANLRLREKFNSPSRTYNPQPTTFFPPIEYCTDNAVTIGSYAYFHNEPLDWHDVTAYPNLSVEIIESS